MTKWKMTLLVLCGVLISLAACSVDADGAATLLVSNSSTLRVRCLVDDGQAAIAFWVESREEVSQLLEMGEYRVKIELYRGDRAISARLYTLSLTRVGRVHQLLIDESWAEDGVLK